MAQTLRVNIIGDAASLDRTFRKVSSSAGSFGSRLGGAFRTAAKGAAILASGAALGGLALTLHAGAQEWAEHARVAAQTAAVLKSTGGVANVTQKQVESLAGALLQKTGVDDEAIQSGENMLLTFKGIRNEVGAGNDIFNQASKAVLDMDVAMSHGNVTAENMSKTSILVGKALNDPIKGVTALRRVGVQLTEQQTSQIKAFVASGHAMAAQKIILGELRSEFGKSGEALGNTLPGKLNILRETFRNVAGDLVGMVAPAFGKVLTLADKGVVAFGNFVQKLGEQKGASAKLDFAIDTGKDLAVKVGTALGNAVAQVDWHAVWAKAQGIGEGLVAKLQATDWTMVGSALGSGIAAGVQRTGEIAVRIAAIIGDAVHAVNWNALGRAAGPGLAAAMVSAVATLSDPSFWKKNWDLMLSIALVAFSDGLLGAVAKFARPLRGLMESAFLGALTAIERVAPRLAAATLEAVSRLPSIVEHALSPLVGLVARLFGKLPALARFTVKVLGIDAAINAIVSFAETVKSWIDKVIDWFKGLPGRIIGAVGHPDLSGIGSSIIDSLWNGLKAKWGAVEGWFHSITAKIPHLKGPEAKDRMLLVKNGEAIMEGLLAGLQSKLPDNEAFLSKVAGRLGAAMARLQAQLDASQKRAADQQSQQALADAEKQLVAAKKSGKGLAEAEKGVQDALQQIRDTSNQRELDKLSKQHDRILAKLDTLKQRAAAKLQRLQDAAGTAFDDLANRIQRGFQAKSDAWVAPAQEAINAILRSQQQDDLTKAVTDAQAAVADAIANGGDVLGAQRDLQRAQSDLLINGVGGLQDQAAAQQKTHEQAVAAQQDALDQMLAGLRKSLTTQGETWTDGMSDILGIITKFDGPFGDVGALLGSSFVASLIKAAKATASAGGDVSGAGGAGGGGGGGGAPDALSRFLGNRVLHLAGGGDITRSGFAFVHAGERVSRGSASASPLGRGGGITFEDGAIQIHGTLITERQLEDVVVGAVKRANLNGNFDVNRDLN